MSRLEPADDIERIVGASRHETLHIGCAVSEEQRVYVLHSEECCERRDDLRDCPYSLALDRGIDPDEWVEDEAVLLTCELDEFGARLVPMRVSHLMADPAESSTGDQPFVSGEGTPRDA